MVIWVIGRSYPLPENGMQGMFELEQAKMLARCGEEVHYLACSLHPFKKIKGRGFRTWQEDNVQISVLSAFLTPRIYPLYFVGLRNKCWKSLFDEVEKRSGIPDVIHVHYPAMLMIAGSLQRYHEKGVRVAATEHWMKVLEKKLDDIELREFKRYNAVLDKMICVGSPLKDSVKALTGMDAVLVPNVVNGLFKPSQAAHGGFRFVAVGRLIKLKQFDKIIEAFCDCFLGQEDVSLTIVGGGEEESVLDKIVLERKAEKQVSLVGNKTHEETAEIVANCDCLICYSEFETFGVPIIEAWACGLPTISTMTAAAVIDNPDEQLGVKVDYTDFDSLKKAMQCIYEQRDRYSKEYISNYAVTHFSEEVISRGLIKLYEE